MQTLTMRPVLLKKIGRCGDLIAVDKIYNRESFSKMLNRDKNPEYCQSLKDLLSDLKKYSHKNLTAVVK
jgi:hypothetical protein